MTPMFPSLCRAAALSLLALGASVGLAKAEDYGVFCAGDRVVVDSRSSDEMKSQRGACAFSRFSTRSSAESFARKNFGSVGASCSCK